MLPLLDSLAGQLYGALNVLLPCKYFTPGIAGGRKVLYLVPVASTLVHNSGVLLQPQQPQVSYKKQ